MRYDLAAVALAIDTFQVPSRLHQRKFQDLPEGMDLLLRIVSGDEDAKIKVSVELGRTAETVRLATEFFVEQVLMAPLSDAYRVLGSSRESNILVLRRNMKLLLRWAHPDIATAPERRYSALRVTAAWNNVKTPERRAEYDRRLELKHAASPQVAKPHRPSFAERSHLPRNLREAARHGTLHPRGKSIYKTSKWYQLLKWLSDPFRRPFR